MYWFFMFQRVITIPTKLKGTLVLDAKKTNEDIKHQS